MPLFFTGIGRERETMLIDDDDDSGLAGDGPAGVRADLDWRGAWPATGGGTVLLALLPGARAGLRELARAAEVCRGLPVSYRSNVFS